jgi:hypothetical protein
MFGAVSQKAKRILCKGGTEARLQRQGRRHTMAVGSELEGTRAENLIHSRAGFPQQEHRKCREAVVGRWLNHNVDNTGAAGEALTQE